MFTPLEHLMLKELKTDRPQGKWLCAVSGGLDSVAGLHLLLRVSKVLKIELAVGHVNHGPVEDKEQRKFRLKAYMQTHQMAQKLGLEFFSRVAAQNLKSEADLRKFRYQALREMEQQSGAQGVITFHHQEDLLETRLLRLLRGVGPHGLVAMSRRKKDLWRPFLHLSKQVLADFAAENSLSFVDDPSNSSTRYLRNWLRIHWLSPLQKDHPSSLKSLARSLEQISVRQQIDWSSLQDGTGGILRNSYSQLSMSQQREVLVMHLKTLAPVELRASQYQEILKQLDKSAKQHSFKVAGLLCHLNAERIWFEIAT